MKKHALAELLSLLVTAGVAWLLAIITEPWARVGATAGWGALAILATWALTRRAQDWQVARLRQLGAGPGDLLPLPWLFVLHGAALLAFVYAGWAWTALFALGYGGADCYYGRYVRVTLHFDAHLGRSYSRGRKG